MWFILVAAILGLILLSGANWNKVAALCLLVVAIGVSLPLTFTYAQLWHYNNSITILVLFASWAVSFWLCTLLYRWSPMEAALSQDVAYQEIVRQTKRTAPLVGEQNCVFNITVMCRDYHDMKRKSEKIDSFLAPYRHQLEQHLKQVQKAYQSYHEYSTQIKQWYTQLTDPFLTQKQIKVKEIVLPVPTNNIVHVTFTYKTPKHIRSSTTWLTTEAIRAYLVSAEKHDLEVAAEKARTTQECKNRQKRAAQEKDTFKSQCILMGINPKHAFYPQHVLTNHNVPDVTGCYVLHNITKNRCYVGQATSLNRRLREHFSGRGCEAAYRDWKNGDVFIIESHPLREDEFDTLNEQERYYIAKHRAFENGYNKTHGNG